MGDDISAIYAGAWRFALAAPLLFLVPALPEFAQHVVEAKIGMYDTIAQARAVAHEAGRLCWGYAKTLALLLPSYWLVRYIGFGGDARRARAIEWPAIGLWLVLFALQAGLQAWSLFGPPLASLVGLAGRSASLVSAIAVTVVGVYFTAWVAAWPLGNTDCGPRRSIGLMAGRFWRTVGLMVAGIVPLMALHYALGLGAIGRPMWLVWPMLAADAVVVALLAHKMAGVTIVAARGAARQHGYALAPAAPTGATSVAE